MISPASGHRFTWRDGLYHDPLPVGGIAAALLLGTYALLQLPPSIPLLVAGVSGAALVYGVDRGIAYAPEDRVNHPERQRWIRTHRRWLTVETVGLLAFGGGAFTCLTTESMLVAGALALLASLHLVSFGPWGRPLKNLGIGKPVVVASAWALGGTVLPVVEANGAVGLEAGLLAAYRLFFILPNVLAADWGDRSGDAAAGLHPWAADTSGAGLRWTATGLLVLAAACAVIASTWMGRPLLFLVDGVGLILMIAAVWTLHPARPSHRLLMDGIVAWPLVTAIAAWGLGWGT